MPRRFFGDQHLDVPGDPFPVLFWLPRLAMTFALMRKGFSGHGSNMAPVQSREPKRRFTPSRW